MTLVATVDINGIPMIFGDMLITFEGGKENELIELPTTGKLNGLSRNRPNVEGLWQKVCIISDDLAVAYAGDTRVARIVLRALKTLSERESITVDSLRAFYASREAYFKSSLAIVGILISRISGSEINVSRFGWNAQVREDPGLGKIHCAGQGVDLLDTVIKERMLSASAFSNMPQRSAAIARVLSVCGHLLSEEKATTDPLIVSATGGAYELAFFDGFRFVKPDITFMTWNWTSEDGMLDVSDPILIIKSLHAGNIHLINCARRTLELSQGRYFWQPDLHVTYPIYEPPDIVSKYDDPSIIGFQSDLTQHQLSVFSEERRVSYFSFVETGRSGAFAKSAGREFRMIYEENFLEKITEILRN